MELVTRGLSFSDYLAEIGSGSIFDTSTMSDDRNFSIGPSKKTLELFTIAGVNSFNFHWFSEVLELGLIMCPYELAFEILVKHSNLDLLKTNHYLAAEKGIFILGKDPIFLAMSWLEREWLIPDPEYPWIFCRKFS